MKRDGFSATEHYFEVVVDIYIKMKRHVLINIVFLSSGGRITPSRLVHPHLYQPLRSSLSGYRRWLFILAVLLLFSGQSDLCILSYTNAYLCVRCRRWQKGYELPPCFSYNLRDELSTNRKIRGTKLIQCRIPYPFITECDTNLEPVLPFREILLLI